jgi:hypothetical protein
LDHEIWCAFSIHEAESTTLPDGKLRRLGVFANSGGVGVQYTNDGVRWNTPVLLSPLKAGTWYVATLRTTKFNGVVEVWERDNPSVRAAY